MNAWWVQRDPEDKDFIRILICKYCKTQHQPLHPSMHHPCLSTALLSHRIGYWNFKTCPGHVTHKNNPERVNLFKYIVITPTAAKSEVLVIRRMQCVKNVLREGGVYSQKLYDLSHWNFTQPQYRGYPLPWWWHNYDTLDSFCQS